MRILIAIIGIFCATPLSAASADIQKIKDMYVASFEAIREAKNKADVERVLDSFQAPEWVGNMPAGETLTRVDALAEGLSVLAIPPEERPAPQMRFVFIRETGWNILAVCWRYREVGKTVVGALVRDTWVRTAEGWRRTRTEKFFPDRTLLDGGKALLLPTLE